jgi:Arc/MetJ-type ribon-helix-helix transcriptional regulator
VELAEKIKKRIEGTGFTSLSSYVAFVLRELLSRDKPEANDVQAEPLGTVEKKDLLKRLKNLGYI